MDALRFWIGSETVRRSGIWKIKAHNSSVYITSRSLGGAIKISLHPNCYCSVGFTKEFWDKNKDKLAEPHLSRAQVRWNRRIGAGATLSPVVLLYFPTDLLKRESRVSVQKKMNNYIVFAPASDGQCVEVAVFSSDTLPHQDSSIDGWGVIAGCKLDESESVIIAGRIAEFPGISLNSKDGKAIYVSEALKKRARNYYEDNLSAIIFSDPKDGEVLLLAETNAVVR